MHRYPLHYMETARALHESDSKIRVNNRWEGWIGDISLFDFIKPVVTIEGRKRVFGKGRDGNHIFMSDVVPGLIGLSGIQWERTGIGRLLLDGMEGMGRVRQITDRIGAEVVGFDETKDKWTVADSIRKAIKYYRTEDGRWECPVPIVNDSTCLRNIETYETIPAVCWGTDGSEKDGIAGYGMCVDHLHSADFSGMVHGKQTVNRAEALAVLHSLLVTRSLDWGYIDMYVNLQVTIDGVNRLWRENYNRFRLHKDTANLSIIKAIHKKKLAWQGRPARGFGKSGRGAGVAAGRGAGDERVPSAEGEGHPPRTCQYLFTNSNTRLSIVIPL